MFVFMVYEIEGAIPLLPFILEEMDLLSPGSLLQNPDCDNGHAAIHENCLEHGLGVVILKSNLNPDMATCQILFK